MRAVACHNAELSVVDRPEPVPRAGQVRIEVLRCGICGSDLHARHGVDDWADLAARAGYDRFARSDQEIVFGHEFCGEVAEYGPGCRKATSTGTPVVAVPLLRGSEGVDTVGLSVHAPGAYAEQMLVEESLMMAVPNGLGPDVAALTEPMAVAWHAVRRGEVKKRTVAMVVGCGPIGLGVILMLKAKGVRTVVASDFSPARRALASACGADVVIDPAEGSPFAAADRRGHLNDIPSALELAVSTREKLERLPVGWWHAWRLGEALGAAPKHPGDLRVRRRARRDRQPHRWRAAVLPSGRRRRLRRHRSLHARDGDQQGDRSAVRDRLHAARVPRHPAHARRGQDRPDDR